MTAQEEKLDLATRLLTSGAIKVNPFSLNPWGITQKLSKLAVRCMLEKHREIGSPFDAIAYILGCGDVLAREFSERTGKTVVSLSNRGDDEKPEFVLSSLVREDVHSVLLIDGCLCDESIMVAAVKFLDTMDIRVSCVSVIVDQESDSREELSEWSTLLSVFQKSKLLGFYVSEGLIGPEHNAGPQLGLAA